eukprot:360795-Chlamydomonas_euryale.AAC.1
MSTRVGPAWVVGWVHQVCKGCHCLGRSVGCARCTAVPGCTLLWSGDGHDRVCTPRGFGKMRRVMRTEV